MGKHARRDVAQGSLSSPSADGRLFHRTVVWAARPVEGFQVSWFEARPVKIRVILLAARQEPAPLERPQGRTAGPVLPEWTPMSARPFAVAGRLAVPSVYIAAEPKRVGQALPLLGDRVAQGGKLQARVAPTFRACPEQSEWVGTERRLRFCDPEAPRSIRLGN
jgi:hypothetical protein